MTIDIQPFLDKLDKLQEYMDGKIMGTGKIIQLNFEAIPFTNVDEILKMFFSTGTLMTSSSLTYQYKQTSRVIPFEEWYESQTKK